jgi:hypothetical protein
VCCGGQVIVDHHYVLILNVSLIRTSWFSNRNDDVNVVWHAFELFMSPISSVAFFVQVRSHFPKSSASASGFLNMNPNPSQKSDSSQGTASRHHLGGDRNGGAPAQPKARVKKPRIDIDNQITEANRLSEVLRKVAQAAKTTAKNGTRAKQRLVRKAGKLSSQDLERIAVLKRCGLFTGAMPETETETTPGTPDTGAEDNVNADKQTVRNKIAQTMSTITGADELFGNFKVMKKLGAQSPESLPQSITMSEQSKIVKASCVGQAIVVQPLPSAVAKPVVDVSKPIH